ncbi:MAG: hypothetical protein WCK09_00265 [Bacteroidota bacterium]
MTESDRAALSGQGIIIMRSQCVREGEWTIYQYFLGSWIKSLPCGCGWESKELCDEAIDRIVLKHKTFVKDE